MPYVIVYSAPVEDVDATVSLIRRRVLVAGAVALLVALLAGYAVARALTRRVRRMDRSARRVARGDFSARFETGSRDELGQLAQTLNDMQRQLAALEDARRRFIATASHELRTPIFSLGGFLELIEDEDLDDDTRRQFVRQLREQTDRLGRLRPTCWTSRASAPGRSSCAPSASTWATSRAPSPPSSRPR